MRRSTPAKRRIKKPERLGLAERLGDLPRGRKTGRGLPFSSAEGRARLAEWLESLKRTAAGKALKSLVDEHQPLAALLGGVAAEAPYLWDLVRADPLRLVGFLTHDPENELAKLLARVRADAAPARPATD